MVFETFGERNKNNGGGGKETYKYIGEKIEKNTPQERDFTNDPYETAEINRDLKSIEQYQQKKKIEKERGIADSKIEEYAIVKGLGEDDWFGDYQRDEDIIGEKGRDATTYFASEYDDFTNHIDAVVVVKNADTKYKTLPFAIDMTYRENLSELNQKFGWKHRKLGLAGLAEVKYFEDSDAFEEPEIPKGKIEVLPRFVVGFSESLADELVKGELGRSDWDKLALEELETKAKFCVLNELKDQAGQLLGVLEDKREESLEMRQLYNKVRLLDGYFGNALETARQGDVRGLEDYIDEDRVARRLLTRKLG
ncbi:hypothetical protein IJI02_00875 [Candidatus Saccharibacteria bacterium]|nr:hypothetical protein [Candidatus Saccharibacteria bacterium]